MGWRRLPFARSPLPPSGRHPFLGKWKVGFSKTGEVKALDVELYSNAGSSMDLSQAVMDRALFHSDNVYRVPNIRVRSLTV